MRNLVSGLVHDGYIGKDTARSLLAKAIQDDDNRHPCEIIADEGLEILGGGSLDILALSRWLAKKSDLNFYRVDPIELDPATATRVVSHAYAQRHGILPLEADERRALFATAEPFDLAWADELHRLLNKRIECVLVTPADVRRYLDEFYHVGKYVRDASDQPRANVVTGLVNLEQLVDLGGNVEADATHGQVVRIVDWLLQYAFEQRSSDIHLEPRRDMGYVRFRIDGTLHSVYEFPSPVMAAVTSRFKVLGRMDLAERRRPQDGRIKTRTGNGLEIELRLSTMPTVFGEKCVMRIFDPNFVGKSFADMGLTAQDTETWLRLVERPNGIVLLTGPTGSGKTTTLYTTLDHLAKPEVNVCTVEDPIEMVAPALNQMQVNPAIGLDFAAGIRTLLRQDPDIIMVGEVRDEETAKMAVQASLTGHLVLSTLHTNDAPSAISRLLDIGTPHYLLRATVSGVAAQRLVRTLCAQCKTEAPVDEKLWASFVHPWKVAMPPRLCVPKGCDACRHTGYLGRSALFEILEIGPEVSAAITASADVDQLRRVAIQVGMRTLRTSAVALVVAGMSSIEEVSRVLTPGSI